MDDATALIAAMRAKPEEDTPRLVYADLIEERGQHLRAELIRVQVARARLNPRPRLLLEAFQPRIGGELSGFAAVLAHPFHDLPEFPFTFDAISPNGRDVFAVGCECQQISQHDMSPRVRGHVTGIPCPVRPEADALDAKAAELLGRLPAGTWCPMTFNWDFNAETFAARAVNPEPWVLVRRGFVEHVRCPWDHWLDWADGFRTNHPCERVTLTTMPETREWADQKARVRHFRIKEVPGEVYVSEAELALAYDRAHPRIRLALASLLARHWPGTTFAIP